MSRDWRARFAEPIDFAALAVERSKKGWRPTPAQKAEWAKRREAKRRKERREARKRFEERKRAERQANPPDIAHGAGARFLAAFEPGHWYAMPDLVELSGVKRNSCKAYCTKFWKSGDLERTKNPAFVRQGFMEPEWLYRRVRF